MIDKILKTGDLINISTDILDIPLDNLCDSYDNECIDVPDYYLCYMGYMPCGAKFPMAIGKCPMLNLL